ncbi:hypothetical protein [Metabacillus halosaccharovorans]|uniref:Rho termination factor N-terminal domain-containing protein n=1 Tax=Metabacillus halosaccharovorans TaxID=930124 RepID=A0ABT3DCJ3_9BACI|nr:hypothetical protein [Metabacillus halosaccharovorans]MCV9884711.1 hypothetical protein [Metabacillus halosaccharovorans]
MLKEIRKTAAGTEYWDTEAKKVIIGGVDLAKEPDTDNDINLDEMNAEQLLAFAEENNIDVPGNMSKEETIRKHIAEELGS